MAKQLVCDSCGDTTPDSAQGQHDWIGLTIHKVGVITSITRQYDLCKVCTIRVGRALVAPPRSEG